MTVPDILGQPTEGVTTPPTPTLAARILRVVQRTADAQGSVPMLRVAEKIATELEPEISRLTLERDEHQWNTLEMARKADLAERRAEEAEVEVEHLRSVLAKVQRVFDLQCPPMLPTKYDSRGAWMAHTWWNKVLGPVLREAAACQWCGRCDGHKNGCRLGLGPDECAHDWLDRPESDTRECLVCGIEVAG